MHAQSSLHVSTRECKKIPDIWKNVAERYPDEIALVDPHHGAASELTFAQAFEKIKISTAALRKLGVKKGEDSEPLLDKVDVNSEGSMACQNQEIMYRCSRRTV